MNLSLMNGMPVMPIGPIASPMDFSGDTEHGLYLAEDTQRHALGRRAITWDGRVFRYARCGGADITVTTDGVKNETLLVGNIGTAGGAYAAAPATTAIGATQVLVTFDAGHIGNSTSRNDGEKTGIVPENDLAGGYIHFLTGTVDQDRLIIGNTAVAVGDTSMILYLDAPLNAELTALTSTCEILASPYANVRKCNSEFSSVVGIPNVVATTRQRLWLQTWGPIVIRVDSLAPSKSYRQYIFDDEGVVKGHLTEYTDHNYQHAGFLIEKGVNAADYYQAPFIMLQINP